MQTKISNEDLSAVRRVLSNEVVLDSVAAEYSPHQATLVGVTIILAGDDPEALEKKGTFGSLIETLVCSDRRPPYPSDLVQRSRLLGLHRTADRAGNNLTLTPDSPLANLLRERPTYRNRARK